MGCYLKIQSYKNTVATTSLKQRTENQITTPVMITCMKWISEREEQTN